MTKPIAVGARPRYTIQPIAWPAGVAEARATNAGAYGRQTTAPIVQASPVTASGEACAQHRLLRDHAGRVAERRDDAEHGAKRGVVGVPGGRDPDQRGPREGDHAARQEQPREALLEHQASEDRDEDRADVDKQRGDSGVEVALGGVQGDVVDAEPEHAADRDPAQRPARRHRLATRQRQRPERQRPDHEPAQRQRPGLEVPARVADADERRRPNADGDPGRKQDAWFLCGAPSVMRSH